jgi:hypothetical protein
VIETKDFVKRSSDLSDYKSIDMMMEINSNCKIDREMKMPPEKDKDKVEYLSDDNKSLGINTLKSLDLKKKSKISNQSQKQSSIQS